MGTTEFATSVAAICLFMAVAGLLEFAVPLFVGKPVQQARRTANLVITGVNFGLNWAFNSAAALVAIILSLGPPGLLAITGLPPWAQLLAGVAVLDFCSYVAHRTMHAVPLLWCVHQVHHSDEFVDVTTTFRQHPLENLWRFVLTIAPAWCLGLPAEILVVYRFLSAGNAILEHANIDPWRPLDRALSLFWVTPHVHKVHHSREQQETDSNYGNLLSIYDRLLGTFTPGGNSASVKYGLSGVDNRSATTVRGMLTMPFRG